MMPGSSTGRKRTAGKVGRKKKADISCIQNATTQKIASKVVTRSVAATSTAKSAITQLNSPSSKQKPAPSMTRVEEKTSTAPSNSEAPASSTRAEQKRNSAPSRKNVEEAMVSGPSNSEAPLASEDHVHDEQKVIASLPTEKSIPPPLKDNDQVVPQQEDNGDDGEDIRQSSPEDNGPPAPQLEHYDNEEKVTTPPEATTSQPSENWSLSLSDDSLEEFSDEISEWSFASSHRTAIPGDKDYESNNEEAALNITEARDCHTTFKHGPNISFTILDLPVEMAQGDKIYTKKIGV
ncbi:unnamed protein product [Cylindrotheca closterium]|uniref:Uncharacterized protein n=1 Tax=Cylindrotheca closterium TaxID=2856 RepID=A0AAD2FZA9_9STRA|nr:unnamed protein product [Cylindrotheca closterium]